VCCEERERGREREREREGRVRESERERGRGGGWGWESCREGGMEGMYTNKHCYSVQSLI
jgi:hypothetical protein